MSGSKYLFITKDEKIIKLTSTNNCLVFQGKEEMGGQECLMVTLHYETVNRKPGLLLQVSFERAKFDENASYDYFQQTEEKAFRHMSYATMSMAGSSLWKSMSVPKPIPYIKTTKREMELNV